MDAEKLRLSTTTDGEPPEPGHENLGAPKPIDPRTGQHGAYYVLSEAERVKGFVRPVRRSYIHAKCGSETTMGLALCETYARDPHYYGATFCCHCREHFRLRIEGEWQFFWPDGEPVGSDAEEAEKFMAQKRAEEVDKQRGGGI